MLYRIIRIAATLVALVLGAFAWLAWFAFSPATLNSAKVDFSIPPGSSLRAATRQIVEAGVAIPAWKFNLLARLAGAQTGIKAGSYEIETGITPWKILEKITRGDFAQSQILFIEGWTFHQMRAALDADPDIEHRTVGLSDAQILSLLGAPETSPEGLFFPDTYLFNKGDSDIAILARAYRAMRKQLQSAWAERAPDLPMRTPYEALILASLVEKETGRPADRAMVAGVFINRLRRGMKLQADPAVIYGIGESFDGNLRKKDLETDTPFNTYTRLGLPPHPIAMPGLASIQAVMHPADTDALYFVARGDGSSVFSRTLEEHNRAVAKYQKHAAH